MCILKTVQRFEKVCRCMLVIICVCAGVCECGLCTHSCVCIHTCIHECIRACSKTHMYIQCTYAYIRTCTQDQHGRSVTGTRSGSNETISGGVTGTRASRRNRNPAGSVTGTVPGKKATETMLELSCGGPVFGPILRRHGSLMLTSMLRSRHIEFGVETDSRFGI